MRGATKNMVDKIKYVIVTVILVLTIALGWGWYGYFFDKTLPEFNLTNMTEGMPYAGDVPLTITGKDGYKVADISIFIDGKPLVTKFKIGKREFEHSFSLPTKSMPNGSHTLKIELTDGSYNKNKSTREITFVVDNQPLQAAFVKSEHDNKVFQGRTLHVQFQANKHLASVKAHALSETYDCMPESKESLIYECFIPVRCEEVPNEYLLSIELTDKVGNMMTLESKFQVVAYPFKKQTVTINPDKVKQEAELGKPKAQFVEAMKTISQQSLRQKLWHGPFYAPIEIKGVSTEFGVQRTTQEKGRYIHQGLDVTNAPRSVVWAPQDGIVVLKDRFEDSGNTVVIDHGWRILSLFFHLDSFADGIEVGQPIKRGNPLGKIGMTGYANGFHLHWEMQINGIPVDPLEWTKASF